MKNKATYLEYLEKALEAIGDYFTTDDWLCHQTNISLLTGFIASAAHTLELDSVWVEKADFLLSTSQEIQGRKQSGSNDNSLCCQVRSTIRGMKYSLPQTEGANHYQVDKKVIDILDNRARYISEETGR